MHSYVVEIPIQEQVNLRQEHVQVERYKLTDGEVVNPDLTEKIIGMTDTGDEVVVGKTARVVEEVSLRKQGAEASTKEAKATAASTVHVPMPHDDTHE